jgi:hypothetical protein
VKCLSRGLCTSLELILGAIIDTWRVLFLAGYVKLP